MNRIDIVGDAAGSRPLFQHRLHEDRWTPPRATYRLQLTKDFPFAAARETAPHLARLGISHVYLSPILAARPGSGHAYDVVDHDRLNPELGTEAEFIRMATNFRHHGLGILLDIVPNHMGIGPDNPRWMELLTWGPRARNADFFDIDWRPPQPHLVGRVMLPVLDRPLGEALADGGITLDFDGEAFIARQGCQFWPLTPPSYALILAEALGHDDELVRGFGALDRIEGREAPYRAARRLQSDLAERTGAHRAIEAALAVFQADPARLRTLLDRQCWHLEDWRKAASEINYRRFFAINDLAAIRVEREPVFETSHRLILRFVEDGLIDGLRIDHIDGLADPKRYLERLARAMTARGRHPFILVEKILAPDEALPSTWPVMGSTGYDRIRPIERLFLDPPGIADIVRRYRDFTGRRTEPASLVRAAKERFLDQEYASELDRLARKARGIAATKDEFQALSAETIAAGFRSVIAVLPIYRTYIDRVGGSDTDRIRLATAIDGADLTDATLERFFRFLLLEQSFEQQVLDTIILFQQLSGPAMAKGLEDTVFFQHVPLLALNEVGGEADHEPGDVGEFHAYCAAEAKTHPDALIAGSTHDTKRGEDARARLLCLSSAPALWDEALARWHGWNRRFICPLDLGPAPDANTEYYLYQSLIAAWPPGLDPTDRAGLTAFADRLRPAMLKAVREAKERTSWNEPDHDYEAALDAFIDALFSPALSAAFLADAALFCERLGFWGALTSLSATLIRLTTPGVPDLYQGTEGWNFSLVDPDNRRPVDFATRRGGDASIPRGTLARHWHDGAVKTFLIRRILALRAVEPALFAAGAYQPLAPEGDRVDCLIAFARETVEARLVVLAPRFWPRLRPDGGAPALWGDTRLALPTGRYRNVLTGRIFEGGQGRRVAELLEGFAVGALIAEAAR